MRLHRILLYSLFLIHLGVVFYIWYSNSGSLLFGRGVLQYAPTSSVLLSLGRIAGLLAINFVLLQLLLIGRVKWIETVFGLDHLSRAHAINGKYIIFPLLLTHVLCILIAYSMINKVDVVAQFIDFVYNWEDLLNAIIGFALFLAVIILSITIVRKHLKYEFWYLTHLFVYLAIILSWGHQLKWGEDLQIQFATMYWYFLFLFVFGNLIIFRILKPWAIFLKHRFYIENIVSETPDVTSFYITGKNMDSFHVSPGQFMIFRFFSKKFWWQAHPFSLSRPTDGKYIRISVKNSGDFTADLPAVQKGTHVFIDGGHGIFTKKFATKNKILFIAGGIGVTPIRSLVEDMAQNGKDIIFLYSNKTKSEIAFPKEFENLQKQYGFTLHNILTQEPNWKGESGRIDEEKLKKLVPDVTDREIFLCGPVPMMDAIVEILKKLGIKKQYIHYEKFSL